MQKIKALAQSIQDIPFFKADWCDRAHFRTGYFDKSLSLSLSLKTRLLKDLLVNIGYSQETYWV